MVKVIIYSQKKKKAFFRVDPQIFPPQKVAFGRKECRSTERESCSQQRRPTAHTHTYHGLDWHWIYIYVERWNQSRAMHGHQDRRRRLQQQQPRRQQRQLDMQQSVGRSVGFSDALLPSLKVPKHQTEKSKRKKSVVKCFICGDAILNNILQLLFLFP